MDVNGSQAELGKGTQNMTTRIRLLLRYSAWTLLSVLLLYWLAVAGQLVWNGINGGWPQAVDYLRENARAFEPRILSWSEVLLRYGLVAVLTIASGLVVWISRKPKADKNPMGSVEKSSSGW